MIPPLVFLGMSMHRNSHIDGMSLPSSCSASDWLKQILLVVNQSEADIVSDESSVWNFWHRFSEVISGKPVVHCEISAVFSSYVYFVFFLVLTKDSNKENWISPLLGKIHAQDIPKFPLSPLNNHKTKEILNQTRLKTCNSWYPDQRVFPLFY